MSSPTPYANLKPEEILNAVETLGIRCNGSLNALNSYENRVYQIGIEDSPPLIAKFYRPNRWSDAAILEEHQFATELMTQDIPMVGPLCFQGRTLHHFNEFRYALFPRFGGRSIELDNLEHLEWMGRLLGRLHAVAACHSFQHRIRLDVLSYGSQPYQFLIDQDFIPESLRENYCTTMVQLLERIEKVFALVGDVTYLRLHGDCHAGNILWRDTGPHLVDLDDCLSGPAIQDMWMLLSGTQTEMRLQLDHVLDGYLEFYDFNFREIHLIEALRALRMIHYAGWLAKRWNDPAFPLNFPWFNTAKYWEAELQHLREQTGLLDEKIETLLDG